MWIKKGLIYNGQHCQLVVPQKIGDDRLRIFYTKRDTFNRSRISAIETTEKVPCFLKQCKEYLDLGEEGSFDCDGTMTSCLISNMFYYTGWKKTEGTKYELSIGLAIYENDFLYKVGQIISSGEEDNWICCSPSVIKEEIWKMWFISGRNRKWIKLKNDTDAPLYGIRYATSEDGINWGQKEINFPFFDNEIISRPMVLKDEVYHMWYSYMILEIPKIYKIGYATSEDGINWVRKDSGIGLSEFGWDSEMASYPWVHLCDGKKYMFYSGNGFGKSGFGYAIS